MKYNWKTTICIYYILDELFVHLEDRKIKYLHIFSFIYYLSFYQTKPSSDSYCLRCIIMCFIITQRRDWEVKVKVKQHFHSIYFGMRRKLLSLNVLFQVKCNFFSLSSYESPIPILSPLTHSSISL